MIVSDVKDAATLEREPEDYYGEGEVVVDPYRLGRVTVARRLPPQERAQIAL